MPANRLAGQLYPKITLASQLALTGSVPNYRGMRIERKGPIAPLTPRVVDFLKKKLAGKSLDDLVHTEESRADYVCLNGLVVVELKTLEDGGETRLANVQSDLQSQKDWPSFYGSWPMESVLKHLEKPEEAAHLLTERIARVIVRDIQKADKQFAAHSKMFPRKNLVRVLIIVNEDHPLYDPDVVNSVIHKTLAPRRSGEIRYPNIDAAIFITERHAMSHHRQLLFPYRHSFGCAYRTLEGRDNR